MTLALVEDPVWDRKGVHTSESAVLPAGVTGVIAPGVAPDDPATLPLEEAALVA